MLFNYFVIAPDQHKGGQKIKSSEGKQNSDLWFQWWKGR
jgi:hypothetical protein